MTHHFPLQAQAAVGHGNGNFTIETISVAAPGRGEVCVQLKASGVCHTDWDSLSWKKKVVLGHEGAGIVAAVGSGVTHVAVGDSVMLNWAMTCGSCFQCLRGNHALCEAHSPVAGLDPMGGHAHAAATQWQGEPLTRSFHLGTLSTHTVVKQEAVVRLPDGIPFASAAIMGCGVMTGYGSVVNAAQVTPGTSVVVIGCGGVGLNVIQGAKIAGAGQIIAVDLNENRLEMAKRFGATETLHTRREDIGLKDAAQEVKRRTGGRGADYAFESTAVPALGAAPLAMARHGGMAVQVSGIEQDLTIDMNLFEWDKVYLNPLYGKCCPSRDFPRMFALYQQKKLLLDELVTRTYRLADLKQAFEDMHAGRNAKGVILFD
jgi:S-(hydroxymethyl)glutathione dehydrogenase / alcohol dehydrogenase